MVVSDLDGTLLNSLGKVSDEDFKTLNKLGKLGVIRVIATGRTPYSFSKVIEDDFPIDFLIFSSGAGAMEWKTKKIIYTSQISPYQIQFISSILIKRGVDFMVHEPIPANHRFLYFASGKSNPDFERRIELYKPFCQPFIPGIQYDTSATQVLAVLPFDIELFESLKLEFPDHKVIRATSPLDGKSIWMEIFSPEVSKAYGIRMIGDLLGISKEDTIAIGNDFNDVDMLSHIKRSYVVENAPNELIQMYNRVKSNNDSGFSHAVTIALENVNI